ncbi:MAG: DUF5131 family protein [Phycisphaerales bacterium]
MSGESGIEWCDRSWEVVAGCTKVSSGCANCYAERLVGTRHAGVARKRKRDGVDNGSAIDLSLEVINDKGRWSGDVRLLEMNLGQPLSRKAPTVYFVNSRSDLFHEDVPFSYVDKVFAVMALCPRHRFLVLTKRPERMRAYLDWKGLGLDVRIQDAAWYSFAQKLECSMPLPNVWLGASVEDQETANTRLPELLACPAAGRFISAEPLLGPVELPLRISQIQRHAQLGYSDASRVQSSLWVIVGGESGPGARVCNVAWIRSVVEQCRGRLAGVPVFVKQLGADVRDRNDAGFEGEPEDAWDLAVIRDVEHDPDGDSTQYQGKPVRVRLNSSKGNDPAEWPAGLRVRDVPAGLVIGEVSA